MEYSRKELQKLCKQYGIKANLKTAEMLRIIQEKELEANNNNNYIPNQNKAIIKVIEKDDDIQEGEEQSENNESLVEDLDVQNWLKENGFEKYIERFQKERIDFESFKLLNLEALHLMKIPIGDCLKILNKLQIEQQSSFSEVLKKLINEVITENSIQTINNSCIPIKKTPLLEETRNKEEKQIKDVTKEPQTPDQEIKTKVFIHTKNDIDNELIHEKENQRIENQEIQSENQDSDKKRKLPSEFDNSLTPAKIFSKPFTTPGQSRKRWEDSPKLDVSSLNSPLKKRASLSVYHSYFNSTDSSSS